MWLATTMTPPVAGSRSTFCQSRRESGARTMFSALTSGRIVRSPASWLTASSRGTGVDEPSCPMPLPIRPLARCARSTPPRALVTLVREPRVAGSTPLMSTTPASTPSAPHPAGSGVGAVVALKAGEFVKSRLEPLPQPLRQRLAWTMAVDTLRSLREAVDAVVVVSDQPALRHRLLRAGLGNVEVVPEGRPVGMNEALRLGADRVRAAALPRVLACVGDLPALR